MTPEQIAEMIAKSLEKSLPEAVGMVVEEKLKELNIDATTEEVAEIKASLEQLVKDSKFKAGEDETDEKKLKRDQKNLALYMKCLKKSGTAREAMALAQSQSKDFQSEGVDADGGFLLPTTFMSGVLRLANAKGIARRYCKFVPMASKTLNLRKVATDPAVGWVDEGALIPRKKFTLARNELSAKKLGALIPSTLELIEDSTSDVDVRDIAMTACVNAILRFEDQQVFNGDGTGSNLQGLLTHPNVVVYTLPAGKTSFSDITYDDIVNVEDLVDDESIDNEDDLRWYFNRTNRGSIRKIKDANGRPIFDGDGKDKTLDGYDIVTVPAMPNKASSGADTPFLIFGDLKAFLVGDRKRVTFDLGESGNDFAEYKKSLRVIERIDGELIKPKLIVVVKTAAA